MWRKAFYTPSLYKESVLQLTNRWVTVGLHQCCSFVPVLFNIYLKKVIGDRLQEYHTSMSIRRRLLSNLSYADNIDLMAGSNNELQTSLKLVTSSSVYGMKINMDKVMI